MALAGIKTDLHALKWMLTTNIAGTLVLNTGRTRILGEAGAMLLKLFLH